MGTDWSAEETGGALLGTPKWVPLAVVGSMLAAVCMFVATSGNAAATSNGPKRVLILQSFGQHFEPFQSAASSFRTELAEQSSKPIESAPTAAATTVTTAASPLDLSESSQPVQQGGSPPMA